MNQRTGGKTETHHRVVGVLQLLLYSLVVRVARLGGMRDLVDVRQQCVNRLHAVAPQFHLLRQRAHRGGLRKREDPSKKLVNRTSVDPYASMALWAPPRKQRAPSLRTSMPRAQQQLCIAPEPASTLKQKREASSTTRGQASRLCCSLAWRKRAGHGTNLVSGGEPP
jgi:hypothetical protein